MNATLAARRLTTAVLAALYAFPAMADSLRTEIEALAGNHGFALSGVESLKGEATPPSDGPLFDRLLRLLSDYNFIIERDENGVVRSLTIVARGEASGARAPEPDAPKAALHEQFVEAQLVGPRGSPLPARLLVDTGASTIVLPDTMIGPLGFAVANLRPVRMQTVNGMTMGRVAELASVTIGDATAHDVMVAFVPDAHLGGKQLLGMSFLGRFRMTIDTASNVFRLDPRGQ